MHIELILEEPSAEAFLKEFMPKITPPDASWNPIVFQGKSDLLANLQKRLKGYSSWIPDDWKIVVLIDEDREDCRELKIRLERAASEAGLMTKTRARNGSFAVLNRIAVEELEAWFLGDPQALNAAYPRVKPSFASKVQYRNPDAVAGGTWEALERILQRAGYYQGGIAKIEVARNVARHMDAPRNSSESFRRFVNGVMSL
ncbi:MAG: DUF4276 family protein [Opitutaceae bacterium]|jgi:hypothetical protein